jgi:hypothetical protein
VDRRLFLGTAGALAIGAVRVPLAALAAQRIAIGIESDGTLDGKMLMRLLDRLSANILRAGHMQIVDRARLAAVLREQGLSNSAYADPRTAAELGKIVGASRLLHVTASLEDDSESGAFVTTISATVTASYSLVAVDTARVVDAGTADGTGERRSAAGSLRAGSDERLVRQAVDACADDLADQLEPK